MNIVGLQNNYILGDIDGNLKKIFSILNSHSADIYVTTELALTGYYPKDLLYNKHLIQEQLKALDSIIEWSTDKDSLIIIGVALPVSETSHLFYNSLVGIYKGNIIYTYHKQCLPTYNVFDEHRHFQAGSAEQDMFLNYKGYNIGFMICEDAWSSNDLYQNVPIDILSEQLLNNNEKLDLLISINASPGSIKKIPVRFGIFENLVDQFNCSTLYMNQVGGHDELIYDGYSFYINKDKNIVTAKYCDEDILTINENTKYTNEIDESLMDDNYIFYKQIKLGLIDYLHKQNMTDVVIGSSGGIDSALTMALAVEALGPEHVHAITMPSTYSSEGSISDSQELCDNLGIQLYTRPIRKDFELSVGEFKNAFGTEPSLLTQENMQARIRGRILMEYSNNFGCFVLSTGNKSEMSVGYATLYGDMNGGLNLIGDLYKMEVYSLSKYINSINDKEIIPQTIIDKEPSAELSPDQKDTDSLPDYPVLDIILKEYIEFDNSDLSAYNIEQDLVKEVIQKVKQSEFKRRQAPPIIRLQNRSFGFGRQIPIVAKY